MKRTIAEVMTWFAGSLAIFLLVVNPLVCELDHCCDSCEPCCNDESEPVCQCPCGLISVQSDRVDLGVRIPFDEQVITVYSVSIPEGFSSEIERPPIAA